MIDEFHVMYMYKKIQAEAATTDIKTLEQLLKKSSGAWLTNVGKNTIRRLVRKKRKLKMKKITKNVWEDDVWPSRQKISLTDKCSV